jgi:hypothetical protein
MAACVRKHKNPRVGASILASLSQIINQVKVELAKFSVLNTFLIEKHLAKP